MRFVVDAQPPPALAGWLEAKGHEASHVYDVGLLEARDREIWEHAGSTGAAIVTKDEDFVTLLSVRPKGASVVWIRLGNTTKRALLDWFDQVLPQIEKALVNGEKLVEVT